LGAYALIQWIDADAKNDLDLKEKIKDWIEENYFGDLKDFAMKDESGH